MTIDYNTSPPHDSRSPPTHPINGRGKSLPILKRDHNGSFPVTFCDVCPEKTKTQHYCLRKVVSTARFQLLHAEGNTFAGHICRLATCHKCKLSNGVESSNRCVECYSAKTTEDLEKMNTEELKGLTRSKNITLGSKSTNPHRKTLLKALKSHYDLE